MRALINSAAVWSQVKEIEKYLGTWDGNRIISVQEQAANYIERARAAKREKQKRAKEGAL